MSSSDKLPGFGKKGISEEISIFFAFLVMLALVVSGFMIGNWYKKSSEDKVSEFIELQDSNRFLNTFLNLQTSKGRMFDVLIDSRYLSYRYSLSSKTEFSKEAQSMLEKIYGETKCFDLLIDGSSAFASSEGDCGEKKIDAEVVYPVYGRNVTVELIIE